MNDHAHYYNHITHKSSKLVVISNREIDLKSKAYKDDHLNSHVVDWGIFFQTSLKKFLSKVKNQLHEKFSVPS